MSITGSKRDVADHFALPFGDAAKALWDRLCARLPPCAYGFPRDARLLRDIGVELSERADLRLVAAPDEDPLSNHGLNAGAFDIRIRRHCGRRDEDEANC